MQTYSTVFTCDTPVSTYDWNNATDWLTQEYSLVKVADTQHVLFVQLVDGFEVQLKIAHVQQTVVSVFGAPKYLQMFRVDIDFLLEK